MNGVTGLVFKSGSHPKCSEIDMGGWDRSVKKNQAKKMQSESRPIVKIEERDEININLSRKAPFPAAATFMPHSSPFGNHLFWPQVHRLVILSKRLPKTQSSHNLRPAVLHRIPSLVQLQ